jgi:signal peptidase I
MYNDPQLYTTQNDAALAFAGGMLLFLFVVGIISYVLTALGLMKFFEKAGRPAWAAWVPFYNVWVMGEVAKVEKYWLWLFVGGVVVSVIPVLGQLLSLVTVVAVVYITHYFLKQYGKDTGHTILAVLFPFVYYPVVGYSKDLKFTGTKAEAPKI